MGVGDDQLHPGQPAGLEDRRNAVQKAPSSLSPTSALLRHGPEHLKAVEAGLRDWLEEQCMESVGHARGMCSQRSVRDPAAWERANYITMLASYPDQARTQAR